MVNSGLQSALFKAEVFGWEESEMLHHVCDMELSLSFLEGGDHILMEWGSGKEGNYFLLHVCSKML